MYKMQIQHISEQIHVVSNCLISQIPEWFLEQTESLQGLNSVPETNKQRSLINTADCKYTRSVG